MSGNDDIDLVTGSRRYKTAEEWRKWAQENPATETATAINSGAMTDDTALAIARTVANAVYGREFPGGKIQMQAAIQVAIAGSADGEAVKGRQEIVWWLREIAGGDIPETISPRTAGMLADMLSAT